MENILNFRTLATNQRNKNNKAIIPNTIFRSGMVGLASDKDIKDMKELNITQILDFRSDDEIKKLPQLVMFRTSSYDILSLAQNNLDNFSELNPDELENHMMMLYGELFPKTKTYGRVLEEIRTLNYPNFLFHCSAGKDRTGVFGIILMMILDFDLNVIKEEYLKIEEIAINELKLYFKKSFNIKDIEKFIVYTILKKLTSISF